MKVEDILSGGHKRRHRRGTRLPRMRGVELSPINLKEGGHMPGVGPIHIDEIKPTLARLEKDIGVDLQNNTLGSVGKKEFSGDIDVAIHIPADQVDEFMKKVATSSLVDEVKKGPLVVLSRVKIVNYDMNKEGAPKERTGFVQVDFMIDEDPEWLKTFYHAPHKDDSKYKGAHRNIVIGALTPYVNPKASEEKTPDGRPSEVERYMFSSKQGLVRIIRRPKPKSNGDGYTKAWTNEVVGGPWKSGDEIAAKLGLGNAKDLDSFESVFAKIEQVHGKEVAAKVAQDLANNKTIQDLGVPEELGKYL